MKNRLAICVLLFFALTGCDELIKPDPPSLHNVNTTFSDVDKFYEEIAKRVKDKIGGDKIPNFIVVPSSGEWPIGTVIRPGTSFPVDTKECLAKENQVASASASNIFPDYASSYKKSIDLGIDNELIKNLFDAGLVLKDKDEIVLKVADSKYEVIDDTTFAKIIAEPNCKSILHGKELWIVRGYFVGKRTFTFKTEVNREVKAKIEKIAKFDVEFGSGDSSVKVTDDASHKFIQMITAIKIEQGVTISSLPTAPREIGRVYIQKDKLDESIKSESVRTSLRAADFKVESKIESIDSSRMPNNAQVRFFNDSDRDLATKAAEKLRPIFPKITIFKVRLPSPAGQLEVWLPRVGSPGTI